MRPSGPGRKAVTLLLPILLLGPAGARPAASASPDRFPGDAEYTRQVRAIVAEVAGDAITLDGVNRGRPLRRAELCRTLVDRHQQGTSGTPNPTRTPTQTQAGFLNCPDLDRAALQAACIEALRRPDGYDGPEGWRRWSGDHAGTWRNDAPDGREFTASAVWAEPRPVRSHARGDVDRDGRPRQYDFQDVHWPGREVGRYGWNQSHADVPYVWAWDPKQAGNAGGEHGTHAGFTIDAAPCHFIVWISAREAFLEGIHARGGRRTRTGLSGRGQWLVD